MSLAELLIIFIVALVVFGPSKLPMLAAHLATLVGFLAERQQLITKFWQEQVNVCQLQDNEKKASQADFHYNESPQNKSK